MTRQKINTTDIQVREIYEQKYIRKSALFGMIEWKEVISSEKKGQDIIIYSKEKINNIVFNGKIINK